MLLDLHFPYSLIHFGNSVYQFLRHLICFCPSDYTVPPQGVSSVKAIGHLNLGVEPNHSSILRFQYVLSSVLLFSYPVQCIDPNFTFFYQQGMIFDHRSLI